MKASKAAHFSCLETIETKYQAGGAPSLAENLELEKLLAVHDRNVLAFQTAMAAVTDADARVLYWYVDDHFVGRIAADGLFFWRGAAGRYTVTAVDDLGRAGTGPLTVLPVAGVLPAAMAQHPERSTAF